MRPLIRVVTMGMRVLYSESWHVSSLMLVVTTVIVVLTLLQRYLTVGKDAREPPFIPTKIPLLGHLVHLIREGADYYSRLEQQHGHGIYTLPILVGRMYIVASPEWTSAIHRANKSLQFNTFIAQAMKNLFCMDEAAMKLINENLNGENGKREGIMLEIHDMMQATLAQGPLLDKLNKSVLETIAPDFSTLAKEGPTEIKLWEWLRHHFSVASVAAIWGPRNPFTMHPEVEAAFWEFEGNALALTMSPLPQIFARRGYKARQQVLHSFEEYMEQEAYNDAETSQLVRSRAEINMGKFKLSTKMHAWGDASLLFGALLNTIPLTFWLVSWIFQDEQLLHEIRQEMDACITMPDHKPSKCIINATKLRTSCPLFCSTFREALRVVGGLNSNRYVAEDTTITNSTTSETYLLKKGSVVQIAGNVIHFKPLWGSDAFSFNAKRFMSPHTQSRNHEGSTKSQDPAATFRDADGKPHSSAFRSFGGGNNVCPGRYFAQTEILGLVSLFVAGFDISNVERNGSFTPPPYEDFKLMMSVIKPGRDVDVRISRRKGYEQVDFGFEM